jgi:SAM-dependent methyltransferase
MQDFLSDCRRDGWRHAIQAADANWRDSIAKPERAAFQDVMPVPEGSCILDVGAGMGCLSAELVRRHRVVALEGVAERAEFLALRKKQDGLENLTVLNADLNSVRFDHGQFDLVVVNGVLEWVGLFDTTVTPDAAQVRFLHRLRDALKPNGYIYVAIENRIGWNQLRGLQDHSGLPYTSLMPRFLASLVCRHTDYRSQQNLGYRTYTYTFRGYRELFLRAGLQIRDTWIAPLGYNLPTDLIPLSRLAIQQYTTKWLNSNHTWKATLRNTLKKLMAQPVVWRNFGSDFVFLLGQSNVPFFA